MAIYHLNVKNISRGDGRSVVAAAAYRAGEVLANEAEEGLSDFGGRRDVVAAEIRLPAGAPVWMADRGKLWNAVETAEVRKDARLAKEVEFALPLELPRDAWLAVARVMADAYTLQGFVVDLAIHDDGLRRNPHVHLLMSTRVVAPDGFGLKIRSADGHRFVKDARVLWERVANEALQAAGSNVAIDSRSYAKRKLEARPGQHRGPDQEERRINKAQAQRERETMARTPDDDLPVPDPDGNPLHPTELAAAEERMLDDMHSDAVPTVELVGDPATARSAIEQVSNHNVSEDDAAIYRLAPENMLDWFDDRTTPEDLVALKEWEDHLDWLEADIDREEQAARQTRQEPEPER